MRTIMQSLLDLPSACKGFLCRHTNYQLSIFNPKIWRARSRPRTSLRNTVPTCLPTSLSKFVGNGCSECWHQDLVFSTSNWIIFWERISLSYHYLLRSPRRPGALVQPQHACFLVGYLERASAAKRSERLRFLFSCRSCTAVWMA